MATGYDYGVRQGLVNKGVDASKIGYDKNSGYVTVGGQNFIKPEKVYQGTSFTSQQGFNQAWDAYNKQQTPQAQQSPTASPYNLAVRNTLGSYGIDSDRVGYDRPSGMVTVDNKPFMNPGRVDQGVSYTSLDDFNNAMRNYNMGNLQQQYMSPQLPQNRYTPQIDETIQYLMNFAKNQQVTDPYSTPEYQAYAAQSARRANQGVRAAQEALGSAGFGRSTALGERAQGIQNAEEEYLTTQVIPQVLAAEQQRRQQEFANVMNLLNPLIGQQGYMDDRSQMERANAMQMLGYLTGEDQRSFQNRTAEEQRAFENELARKQANLNAALSVGDATGRLINPTEDWGGLFRQANREGTPLNLAGQQFQSSEEQRAFENDMVVQKFNENVRQFGLEYALQQASQDLDRQRLALQEDDNMRQWTELDARLSGSGADSGGLTANQVLSNLRSMYTEPVYEQLDPNDPLSATREPRKIGEQITTDPAKRESMFLNVIDAGLSDAETNQILAMLGMSKQEIDGYMKKYGGNG